jgi:hypothetical protein
MFRQVISRERDHCGTSRNALFQVLLCSNTLGDLMPDELPYAFPVLRRDLFELQPHTRLLVYIAGRVAVNNHQREPTAGSRRRDTTSWHKENAMLLIKQFAAAKPRQNVRISGRSYKRTSDQCQSDSSCNGRSFDSKDSPRDPTCGKTYCYFRGATPRTRRWLPA